MVDLHDDSINLRALRKIDDNIQEILFSAGQVAIYYFNVDTGAWKRKEIEGALFLVQRAVQPAFAFVVINKLNTINLVQKITHDFETNLQKPYLMFKNAENEIYCVWFYEKENCVTLNNRIVDIIEKTNKTNLFAQMGLSNQFNGLNIGKPSNPTQANSDLLKLMLSVENNSNNDAETPKAFQPPIPNDVVKPVAQKRNINLNDLFQSHLSITTANTTEINTLKGDDIVPLKPEPVTPYQFMREEKIKNSLITSNASNSTNNHETDPKEMILKSFETLMQPKKKPAAPTNPALFEQNSATKASDGPLILTMQQLKETLVHLLQNDADFLHTIHTTYVSAIKK